MNTKTFSKQKTIEYKTINLKKFKDALLSLGKQILTDESGFGENEMIILCRMSRDIIMNEKTLLKLDAPINVLGDIHGQFNDLIRLMKYNGDIKNTKYLFLGDYIDRGKQSIEAVSLLLIYKCLYPNHIYLLRGNHECASINRVYGFYDECKRRYSIKLWRKFTDLFNYFPVCAIISNKIICMHGGLSPQLKESNINCIDTIIRPTDIPCSGLLCDLLWSDPNPSNDGWDPSDRGVSYVFGKDVVNEFCKTHQIELICRVC